MCIALSCPLGHCVSCLDLNKCRDAALSILFAASSVVFPSDSSQSRIPQGFSQVVFELSVFSFEEVDFSIALCLVSTPLFDRDRLITCSLHWINRMSSDQSGQPYVFASPSLISPQRFGDCRCQGAASLLPCISSLRSNRALRHACRIYQVLSQFEGEDACDRADSVHRDCCRGSSLVLHLAVSFASLGTVAIPLVVRL